jgi:hypothetical protein
MTYQVNWKKLWKKLTKFMCISILIPVIVLLIFYIIKFGSLDNFFAHITILDLSYILLGIVAFSTFFSFFISIIFKFATITVTNGYLTGRNYWLLKKTIPISSIVELYPFSHNGIEAIVVNGGKHGKVYISTYTENLEALILFIKTHMVQK